MGCALIPITFSEIYSIVIFVKYIELQRLDLGYLDTCYQKKVASTQAPKSSDDAVSLAENMLGPN